MLANCEHHDPVERTWKLFRTLGLAAATLGSVMGCARDEFEKPRPPDMSEVIAAYEAPDGTVTDGTLVEASENATEQLEVTGLDLEELIEQLVDELEPANEEMTIDNALRTSSEPIRAKSQAAAIEGEGLATIRHVCRGWSMDPVPDAEQNGRLTVVAGFSESSLDPILWAETERCRYLAGDGRELFIESGAREGGFGDLRLYLGPNPGFDIASVDAVLFQYDFSVTIDGVTAAFDGDYRHVRSTNRIEVRTRTETGNVIVVLEDGQVLSARGQNGEFVCDASRNVCENAEGDAVAFVP